MRRSIILFSFVVFATTVFAQTADEVINKFIEASGGKEKLNSIKTLQYVQTLTLKTPMGDLQVPMQFYREKNKLFRMDASLTLGPQALNFYTLITDTAGYIMLPPMPMLGTDGGIKKMTEDERKSQASQTDPAGMFAPLVNYAGKGSKATLQGTEKVEDEDCYKIRLSSLTTDTITYFISKATNLVTRADTKGSMAVNMSGLGSMMGSMQNQAAKTEVSALYSGYTDVSGVKFPSKIVLKNQMGDAESAVSSIKVNEPIDSKWYKAQ